MTVSSHGNNDVGKCSEGYMTVCSHGCSHGNNDVGKCSVGDVKGI